MPRWPAWAWLCCWPGLPLPSTPPLRNDPPALRTTLPQDRQAVLALNLASEAVLSPLTAAGLEALLAQSWHHRVACLDGHVQAFLIALGPGADYDSPNYQWFSQRYADFVYVDRIVVAAPARQAGLAGLLYDDLIAHARAGGIRRCRGRGVACGCAHDCIGTLGLRHGDRHGHSAIFE